MSSTARYSITLFHVHILVILLWLPRLKSFLAHIKQRLPDSIITFFANTFIFRESLASIQITIFHAHMLIILLRQIHLKIFLVNIKHRPILDNAISRTYTCNFIMAASFKKFSRTYQTAPARYCNNFLANTFIFRESPAPIQNNEISRTYTFFIIAKSFLAFSLTCQHSHLKNLFLALIKIFKRSCIINKNFLSGDE